jgi:hypothetical protein
VVFVHPDDSPIREFRYASRDFIAASHGRSGGFVIRSVRNLMTESRVCRVLGLDLDSLDD